jgi:hypothetical protein
VDNALGDNVRYGTELAFVISARRLPMTLSAASPVFETATVRLPADL